MKVFSPEEMASLLRFSPHPGRAPADGWAVFTILDLEQVAGEGRVDGEGRSEDLARRVRRPARVEEGPSTHSALRQAQGSGSSTGSLRQAQGGAGQSGLAGEGWWELAAGVYLARFNERLAVPPGALLVLQPHPLLLANGVWHLPLLLRAEKDLEEGVMLVVSARGVKIRENAPLSRGMLIG